jgi:transposase
MSCRSAAKIFKVSKSTLRLRMNGYTSLSKRWLASYKLTKLEEDVIIQRILNMDTRGFAPRLAGVEDMANFILKSQAGKCVGTR